MGGREEHYPLQTYFLGALLTAGLGITEDLVNVVFLRAGVGPCLTSDHADQQAR